MGVALHLGGVVSELLSSAWTSFVALFAAMNVLTAASIYLGLTEEVPLDERPNLVRKAVAGATVVALIVAMVGRGALEAMSLTVPDLQLSGGLVLISLALYDLVFGGATRKVRSAHEIGVVPIGVPLLVGPGTMTTVIILVESQGRLAVLIGLLSNLALAWFVLHFAHRVVSLLGRDGIAAVGKVMTLILAAIGAAMLRAGLGLV